MYKTLSYIGEELNKEGVIWGVGASILLNSYGLVESPNDIDILISLDHIEKGDKILKALGVKKQGRSQGVFHTKYFYEYSINGFDLDVMSGLVVNKNGKSFELDFNEESIVKRELIHGVEIPFTSLEEWYVLYQLMENREYKVGLIEEYFEKNGVSNKWLLEKSLKGELPDEVRERILTWIK